MNKTLLNRFLVSHFGNRKSKTCTELSRSIQNQKTQGARQEATGNHLELRFSIREETDEQKDEPNGSLTPFLTSTPTSGSCQVSL